MPTFQYSKKQFLVCTTCHERFEVAKELKPELAARLMSQEELSSLIRRRKSKKSATANYKNKAAAGASGYCCPSCSGEVTEKMVYCPQCGRKLG